MKVRPQIINPDGKFRIIATNRLVGEKWIDILIENDCRVEYLPFGTKLGEKELADFIGDKCDGVIVQLSENWNSELLNELAKAGGKVLALYAVGYNNVDLKAATKFKIKVCNTPDALTKATAELGVALTFAAARRICESDTYMRQGKFKGWHPNLMLGIELHRKTLGVIGLGRIGSVYAEKMIFGNKMNLMYYNPSEKPEFTSKLDKISEFLRQSGEEGITCKKTDLDELLNKSDVIALFPRFTSETEKLIAKSEFSKMKSNAVFVNMSRGKVVDEKALVEHCKANPNFRCGLDVYENEPNLTEGLADLPNAVLTPHSGSATIKARSDMAILVARNIVASLRNFPPKPENMKTEIFWKDNPPNFIPSLVNKNVIVS